MSQYNGWPAQFLFSGSSVSPDCRPINCTVLALADGDHRYDNVPFPHLVDELVPCVAQFDLVTVFYGTQAVSLDPWRFETGNQFRFELFADIRIQFFHSRIVLARKISL